MSRPAPILRYRGMIECDAPHCEAFYVCAPSTGKTMQEARLQAKYSGWHHVMRGGSRDYCPTHARWKWMGEREFSPGARIRRFDGELFTVHEVRQSEMILVLLADEGFWVSLHMNDLPWFCAPTMM